MNEVVVYRTDKNAITAAIRPERRKIRQRHQRCEEHVQLKQIDDFSLSHDTKMWKGIFSAWILISFSFLCVALSMMGVAAISYFLLGTALLLVQLFRLGYEFFQEELRTRHAYHAYLSTFSNDVLRHLRKISNLSVWSQFEIDHYLAQQR